MSSEDTQEPTITTAGSDWRDQVEQVLADWRQRAYAAQTAHYATADRFRLLNYVVGIPAIVFSSLVGTAIFAGLEKGNSKAPLVASASILAAVLAGLQTFLRFSERAGDHATAADWYSAIRRDIEEILSLPIEFRGTAKDCLDSVRKEMNLAAQDAPELNSRFWRREARRFLVREHMAHSESPRAEGPSSADIKAEKRARVR